MDEPIRHAPSVRFAPDRRVTAAAAVGALVAAVLAAVTDDAAGRLLLLVGVVVLLALVAGDLVFSPRLVADAGGVVVRSPLARVALPWPQIEAVRADTRDRLGLRSTTLEVDAGSTLVVCSRRAIGADPAAAAELINAFAPPGAGRSVS
ncbi:PH domain-containing protein [Jatrophihabitans endophyticus]|uniref:PH domain-containing protein n=1 Tax=Jatrophihabitans endophyticus TaxID=1206085 RepID=A0A1M5HXD8_9ACTN|nr:PH domain-containing protein [Jatrophihabitans endophyticus]SHG20671.1 PH domain-containing protein [Jatrophihabitans endophyticus]